MKFYIRELPQQQYHYQSSDHPFLPKNTAPKPGDMWQSQWSDYHIDRVAYSKDGLIVFATRTNLQKARSHTCYRINKENK
ncbi:hypothetical protein FYJ38_00070 [Clostridium sp. WB02_MRS01]|uniref:hypothetical protein n=1 Tax=Clostridium sp. WB02_MRS01 TaxID=2605777 RepID=UPI0012B2FC85|nr:hypothetical protein [Clostridium sp. WB02_MRS01]MSS07033.1 hypothetical protein [Clostridium sp. WB02_MRS01]